MQLDQLLHLVRPAVSGVRAIKTAAAYRPYPLRLSFSSYNAGIAWIRDQYAALGLEAEKIDFPADGRTIYADRHFPLAWDIEDGWLKASVPGLPGMLASYKEDPYGIVPFSAESNGEQGGVMIPASALKDGRQAEAGVKLVVLFEKYPYYDEVQFGLSRGASALVACHSIDPANLMAYHSRCWLNAVFGEGQIDKRSALQSQVDPLAEQFKKASQGITSGMLDALAAICNKPVKKNIHVRRGRRGESGRRSGADPASARSAWAWHLDQRSAPE